MKEERMVKILKALAHPTRLKIAKLLNESEKCVCQITPILGLSQANVSQHLTVLKHFGVVEMEKKGLYVFYRLKNKKYCQLLKTMEEILEEQLKKEEKTLRALRKAK